MPASKIPYPPSPTDVPEGLTDYPDSFTRKQNLLLAGLFVFLILYIAAVILFAMIGVWSVPPPAQDLVLFELVHGEPGEAVPSHRELLPVLWEMGILPDVRVLPNDFRFPGALPQSRDEAIDFALDRLAAKDKDRPRSIVTERFDELFTQSAAGYRPRWRPRARELLITWETTTAAS